MDKAEEKAQAKVEQAQAKAKQAQAEVEQAQAEAQEAQAKAQAKAEEKAAKEQAKAQAKAAKEQAKAEKEQLKNQKKAARTAGPRVREYEEQIEQLKQESIEIEKMIAGYTTSVLTMPIAGYPVDAEVITGYNILPLEGIRIERKIVDLKLEIAKETGEIDEMTYLNYKKFNQIARHNEDASIIQHGLKFKRPFWKLSTDGVHYERDINGNFVLATGVVEEYPSFSTILLNKFGNPQMDENGKFVEAKDQDPMNIYRYRTFHRRNTELEEEVKDNLDVKINTQEMDMTQKVSVVDKVYKIKSIKKDLSEAQKKKAVAAVATVAATCGTVVLGLLSNMEASQIISQGSDMVRNLMNGYETGALNNLTKCLTSVPAQVYAGIAVTAGNLISTIKSSKLVRKLKKKFEKEKELNSEAVETISNLSEPTTSKTR